MGTILLLRCVMDILANTKLKFLNVGKYGGMYADTADFLNLPRPFFSIGIIIEGTGDFYGQNSECVSVFPGDIIIVPNAATYVSHWRGNPHITYITFHFILESGLGESIPIQKICGFEHLINDFCYAYDNFSTPEASFKIISIFYNILNEIFPKMKKMSERHVRASVKKAVDYITLNYTKCIVISKLARMSNLSQSRFFSVFKSETGMTPIEYKNRLCILNAEKLLLTNDLSIEEISEKMGFNSASYFRRIFRKYVGKSPREYKNSICADLRL